MNLSRTWRVIEEHHAGEGGQLYISLHGKPVVDLGFGGLQADSVQAWQSCSKPVGAVAIGQLCDRGQLAFDDPVYRHVREFGAHGKTTVTIRQLLMHTVALRKAIPFTVTDWDEVLARVYAAELRPGWEPGQQAAYVPFWSWHLLGEIVRRLDGREYAQYVRDEIFAPLGLRHSWLSRPPEVPCRPGASGHGPIRELAHFYEGLPRLLRPETLAELTRPQRVGMFDHTFQHPMDWGLGFIVNSNQPAAATLPYGFGAYASPKTFGHGGRQSSMSFCDAARGLVVAWAFTHQPGEIQHHARQRALNNAIYEDLGFA